MDHVAYIRRNKCSVWYLADLTLTNYFSPLSYVVALQFTYEVVCKLAENSFPFLKFIAFQFRTRSFQSKLQYGKYQGHDQVGDRLR